MACLILTSLVTTFSSSIASVFLAVVRGLACSVGGGGGGVVSGCWWLSLGTYGLNGS